MEPAAASEVEIERQKRIPWQRITYRKKSPFSWMDRESLFIIHVSGVQYKWQQGGPSDTLWSNLSTWAADKVKWMPGFLKPFETNVSFHLLFSLHEKKITWRIAFAWLYHGIWSSFENEDDAAFLLMGGEMKRWTGFCWLGTVTFAHTSRSYSWKRAGSRCYVRSSRCPITSSLLLMHGWAIYFIASSHRTLSERFECWLLIICGLSLMWYECL